MRNRFFVALVSALVCVFVLISSIVCVGALEDKYEIEELGMSIKIPKEYTVVTRSLEREDEAFKTLDLDYDETMTAFSAAHIYLQAVSDGEVLRATLTQTADENSEAIFNYSFLNSSERKQILEAFLNSGTYTSGVEIKHNGNIYFDLAFKQQTQSGMIYAYQCHTVINGMNINLTLQKNREELTNDEISVVTDMANTITFDKIIKSSGPSFEWWRILLWLIILCVIAFLAKYFYRQYSSKKTAAVKERKSSRRVVEHKDYSEEDLLITSSSKYHSEVESMKSLLSSMGFEEDEESFEQTLGYDTTDYKERANTDMDTFDINVKSKDPSHGVKFFEDSGESINDKPDYFENYFNEETEKRPVHIRALSTVWLYIKLGFLHLSYFFKNLYNAIMRKLGFRRKK